MKSGESGFYIYENLFFSCLPSQQHFIKTVRDISNFTGEQFTANLQRNTYAEVRFQ